MSEVHGPGGMDCDLIAGYYRWLEYAAFGTLLERARFRWLGEFAGARQILVLGDGDGRFLERLAAACPAARIDSVEVSGRMLALAKERLARSGARRMDHIRFFHADVMRQGPPCGGYDLLVTHFFLDCFDEESLESLASRLVPCLTPEGRWLVADFRIPASGLRAPFCRLSTAILYWFFRQATGLRTRELADFAGLLERHGFLPCKQAEFAGGYVFAEIWRRVPAFKSRE